MIFTKRITRSAALAAVLAGASVPALAFQQCGDPLTCDPGFSGPNAQMPAADTTGSVVIPENVVQYPISVAKFDAALAAMVEGTTPDKIKLQRVEVTLVLQVEDFNLNVQNRDTSSGCNYSLQYLISAQIPANPVLGTNALSANVDLGLGPVPLTAYDGTDGGTDALLVSLADYNPADVVQITCQALEGDLSAWTGPGFASWTLDVLGVFQASGCPQSLQGVSSHLRADVTVDYSYCVEEKPDCTTVCFFCFGDSGDCPCGGDDPMGGCKNSTGNGAVLSATGSGDYAADNLVITASNLPPSVPVIWFQAQSTQRLPIHDGILCLGPSGGGLKIFRIQNGLSSQAGTSVLGSGIIQMSIANPLPLAEIFPGTTWFFQAYYRDNASACGGNANLTNAAEVVFF